MTLKEIGVTKTQSSRLAEAGGAPREAFEELKERIGRKAVNAVRRSEGTRQQMRADEMLALSAQDKTRAIRGGDRKSKSHDGILKLC